MPPTPYQTYKNGYPPTTSPPKCPISHGMHHGSQMHKSHKFSTSPTEIMWVIIERNTHSNKTNFHSIPLPTQKKWICLHLLSCYTNEHINNIRTNRHNKVVNAIAKTLLAYSTTRCFTLTNVGKIQDTPPDSTIPTWLLPCSCYLLRCKCLARLRPDSLCLLGITSTDQPPFLPHPHDFKYFNSLTTTINSRKPTLQGNKQNTMPSKLHWHKNDGQPKPPLLLQPTLEVPSIPGGGLCIPGHELTWVQEGVLFEALAYIVYIREK